MTAYPQSGLAILRRRQVEARTGLSHSTIYDKLNPRSPRHDPTFPKQVRLGGESVGWVANEIDDWIASRIALRDGVNSVDGGGA